MSSFPPLRINHAMFINGGSTSTFYRPADVDGENETAIIMSTSGSTGPSKGS